MTTTATRKVAPPLAASTRLEGIVLGSSALFANSHAQSTTSKEVIRADVAEMARVFNPCVSSARGRPTRPWISAMPGEAIGYVLRAASGPEQSAAAAASTRLANRILCYPYWCHAVQRVAPTKAMLTDRRRMLTFLAGSLAAPAFFVPPAFAQAPAMTRVTAYAFSFAGLEGPDIRLADHAGKPILVVNTASLCGYTPQYAGLQQLWARYHGRGLMIVGVPSNDFGGQEPGGTADIMRTAHGDYGIGFPLAAKAQVKGPNPHPFYKWAAAERPLETPRWNFHKYLVGRDGHIAAVFATEIEPMDARVIDAIMKELPPPE